MLCSRGSAWLPWLLVLGSCGRLGYDLGADPEDVVDPPDASVVDAAPFEPGPPMFGLLFEESCFLRDGVIRCWGGSFGLTSVALEGDRWTQLAGGELHRCAIDADRALYCWGANFDGALGVGDEEPRSEPTRVLPDLGWTQVGAGRFYSCAISGASQLYCWGRNTEGQLGAGAIGGLVDRPLRIGTDADWEQIGNAGNHICAIRAGGQLYCWGNNDRGQVGVGLAAGTVVRTPSHVAGQWRSVAAGKEHTCGIQVDGTLWCWGRNFEGQIGNGVRGAGTDVDTPLQVGADADWSVLGLARFSSCGLRAGGVLACWGNNELGAVGVPGQIYYTRPEPVDAEVWSLTGSSQGEYICALRSDDQLLCWGSNNAGQLGTGDVVARDAPAPVVVAVP
jgi:alpha-tubulin suppressor-like RCC1 family protein